MSMIKKLLHRVYRKLFGNTPKFVIVSFSIMLAAILILLAVVIFRKPKPVIPIADTEKQRRDSIKWLLNKYIEQDSIIARLNRKNDSLEYFSGFTRTYYKEKKVFVYEQSITQLDSTIRKEWQ